MGLLLHILCRAEPVSATAAGAHITALRGLPQTGIAAGEQLNEGRACPAATLEGVFKPGPGARGERAAAATAGGCGCVTGNAAAWQGLDIEPKNQVSGANLSLQTAMSGINLEGKFCSAINISGWKQSCAGRSKNGSNPNSNRSVNSHYRCGWQRMTEIKKPTRMCVA
eukprot:12802-Pelagomonas_calceolata.AAC.5